MIIEVRINNCYAFNEPIVFSMNADMRNKRLSTNVHKENNFNILKTAGIYGPNNSGKTCFTWCIKAIKSIFLNEKPNGLRTNIFNDTSIGNNSGIFNMKDLDKNRCELGITFMYEGEVYSYDINYNPEFREYSKERFSHIVKDEYGNEKEELWVDKDTSTGKYHFKDTELNNMAPFFSSNMLSCYTFNVEGLRYLKKIQEVIQGFANKIDVIDMTSIPLEKTIELLKNPNNIQDKIVDFIKNADLYLDNFEYNRNNLENDRLIDWSTAKYSKDVEATDQLRLVSTYKGKKVPSLIFDSIGTKKFTALAGYVIEALEQGRILIIDELDSSIHFKLTREIVAMFNNTLNTNVQLIFTVHDINLMDCKKLFRKEQIWFVDKDEDRVYMYSLGDFTAADGIRDTTDIVEKYKRGMLGALPEPELINTLIDIKSGGQDIDE